MRATGRAGYTVLEIICVVAIIVIVAAIAIPSMQWYLSDARQTAAGDTIRGQLAETRARAMFEGRPWRLAFLPNTGVFQLAPDESTEWENTSSQDVTETPELVRGLLPKEIVFSLNQEDILKNPQALPGTGTWETIAIYSPDGSTRDDVTIYYGKPGFGPDRVKVRSLTGSVSVEKFEIASDQP